MTNIELTLDDKNIRALLNALSKRCEDASGVMKNIAEEMRKSVDENFEVGGRYSSPDSMTGGKKKWKPLSRATKAIKKRQGKKGPYQILVDSQGGLAASITTKTGKDYAQIGTNKEYAAAQHFGRPAGVEGDEDPSVKILNPENYRHSCILVWAKQNGFGYKRKNR